MGYCVNHPDRETSYRCTKYALYLCEDCLQCRDPEIYCRYREACVIHYMLKSGDLTTPPKASADHAQRPNASVPDE